jgi:methionyl-tRNA formyltransferase
MSLRVVFAGTPEFAVPCLRALLRGPAAPIAVYTQPDRPAGRGRRLQPSPVKQAAQQAGIEVLQPASFKDAEAQDTLRQLAPDLLVVVAYGLILPAAVLAIPRHGGWNVHASLLPRWRGAAPIQRAIEAGDRETGVCLMQMEKGLDTGPVMLRISTNILPTETAGELHDRLALLGAEVLADGIGLLRAGLKPVAQPQPADGVTHAGKLEKAEARLDWQAPAELLARRVRAFNPWPIAEVEVEGERLRIHRAVALPDKHGAAPGSIVAAGTAGLDIACASGCLRLLEVQREGGRAQPVADFLNARPDLRRIGAAG